MIVYLICYAASWILARFGLYYLSEPVLLLAAGYLYYRDFHKTGNMIHLRGLFSAFWVGGQGLSCLKLSHLQRDWKPMTWICFFLAFAGFWLTFEILDRLFGGEERFYSGPAKRRTEIRPLFYCIVCLTVISVAAFVFEAAVLGFVPLFVRGVPHAYSAFHISGVHYFTVSCVLVPSLAVLYFLEGASRSGVKNGMVILMTLIALAIPVLCVSRFQFLFAVLLACFTYGAYRKKLQWWLLFGAVLLVIPVYVLLTFARSHDAVYLNGIFEMKNSQMPLFLSQPYIYIANNYDNFNCMVEALPKHTWGIRMLLPLWALTGLKFKFPYLVSFPIYVDKAELTTLTMFYDAFYDFGVIGVLVFACVLGAVCFFLAEKLKSMRNPMGYLLYGQIAIYMMLSFFTTWFSNPSTWFYLALTGIMAVYCSWSKH